MTYLASEILRAIKGHEMVYDQVSTAASRIWYGRDIREDVDGLVQDSLTDDYDDSYGRVYRLFHLVDNFVEKEMFTEFLKEEMIVDDSLREVSEDYHRFVHIFVSLHKLQEVLIETLKRDGEDIEKEGLSKEFAEWLTLLSVPDKLNTRLEQAKDMLLKELEPILTKYRKYIKDNAMKLLLIQGDVDMDALLRDIFENEGFCVDIAADGEEGLEMMKKNNYKIVLVNTLITKVDPITLIKKFRKNKDKQGKIVVTSNIKIETAVIEVMKAGGGGYEIMTEVTPEQLVQNVKGYVSGELTTEESFKKALIVARANDKKYKGKERGKFKYKDGRLDSIRDTELGDIPLIHEDDSPEEVKSKERIVQEKIKNI